MHDWLVDWLPANQSTSFRYKCRSAPYAVRTGENEKNDLCWPQEVEVREPRRGQQEMGQDLLGSPGTVEDYKRAHRRVRAQMGPAKTHKCHLGILQGHSSICKGNAEHWCFIPPTDKTGKIRWDRVLFARPEAQTMPYSLTVHDYVPGCSTCHEKFDLLAREHRSDDETKAYIARNQTSLSLSPERPRQVKSNPRVASLRKCYLCGQRILQREDAISVVIYGWRHPTCG